MPHAREPEKPIVSGECYKCGGAFQKSDVVLAHKKYPDAAAFHDTCRAPRRDYVIVKWPTGSEKEETCKS